MTERPYETHAFVCTYGPWCPNDGPALDCLKAMKTAVKDAGQVSEVRINRSGCFSQCGNGPMMVVYPGGVWYDHLDVAKAERIVREHILGGTPVEELRYRPEKPGANKTQRVLDIEAKKK